MLFEINENLSLNNKTSQTSQLNALEKNVENNGFTPDKFNCLGPQYHPVYQPTIETERDPRLAESLDRINSISKQQGGAAFVKYKVFRKIIGLALIDSGNLVQSTLISKEFFDLLGLK